MKSLFVRGIVAAVLLLSLRAEATPLDMSDSDRVGDVINKMHGMMSALIAQAGAESRYTLMFAFQRLDATIQSVSLQFAEMENKTMGDLNQTEHQIFADVGLTLNNMEKQIREPIDNATNTVKDFNTVLAQITVLKPLITRYGPANIAPSTRVSTVPIQISGFKLCPGDNVPDATLKIGDRVVRVNGECVNHQITFLVPRNFFQSDDHELGIGTAQLTISYSSSKWFGLRSDVNQVKFRLMFNILPNNLGKVIYTSKYLASKSIPARPFVMEKVSYSRDGHSGDDSFCHDLDPKGGWRFDFNNAHVTWQAGCDHPTGSAEPTQQSSYHICLRIVSPISDKHWASCTSARIEVPMVRDGEDTEEKQQVVKEDLSWDDKTLPLLDRPVSQLIEIQYFDGTIQKASATRPDNSSRYLRIMPDPANKVVFLRPNRTW